MLTLVPRRVAVVCSWYLVATVYVATATYLPWGAGELPSSSKSAGVYAEKSNALKEWSVDERLTDRKYSSGAAVFGDDADIYKYLKSQGRQLMLWRCRNAIQQQYHRHKPIAFIELFCDVIGSVRAVTWTHRGQLIANTDVHLSHFLRPSVVDRYWLSVATHYDAGRYYAPWLDFKLRIYNATRRDSGVYWFRATSPNGDVAQHAVYVDISYVSPSLPPPPAAAHSPMTSLVSRKHHRKSSKAPSNQQLVLNNDDKRKLTAESGVKSAALNVGRRRRLVAKRKQKKVAT